MCDDIDDRGLEVLKNYRVCSHFPMHVSDAELMDDLLDLEFIWLSQGNQEIREAYAG